MTYTKAFAIIARRKGTMPTKKTEQPKISSLSDKADERFIPTGIKELDEILGGGVYRGRITELWGAEGIGKTHVATKLLANLSKDQNVLYIDSEFALNKERVKELGADPDHINYVAHAHLEEVCELMIREVGNYDVIILDSLPALTPLVIDTEAVGGNTIAIFARLIKHWIVKFRPRLGTSKTAFVAINQYRPSIGLYAKIEPPGGMVWRHAVDVRVYLTSNSGDKVEKAGQRTGHYVHAELRKNKLGRPFQKTKFLVEY